MLARLATLALDGPGSDMLMDRGLDWLSICESDHLMYDADRDGGP